jgi:hypothetical protein
MCSCRGDVCVVAVHADGLLSRGLLFGVSTPGGARAVAERTAVAEAVGETPAVVSWFEDFAALPPIGGLEVAASDA